MWIIFRANSSHRNGRDSAVRIRNVMNQTTKMCVWEVLLNFQIIIAANRLKNYARLFFSFHRSFPSCSLLPPLPPSPSAKMSVFYTNLWTSLRWRLRLRSNVKTRRQLANVHWYGFSPVCLRTWLVSLVRSLVVNSHTSHSYLLHLQLISCASAKSSLINPRPHFEQWNGDWSACWLTVWRSKLCFNVNNSRQNSHWYGFSPKMILI